MKKRSTPTEEAGTDSTEYLRERGLGDRQLFGAEAGRPAYCGTLAGLIESLSEAKTADNLSHRLRMLTHPALFVVVEIGYLAVNQDAAVLFLQPINTWHESASTVTWNKGFEEWGGVLGGEVMAAALVDRLVHDCHILSIRGNSDTMLDHRTCRSPARMGDAKLGMMIADGDNDGYAAARY